jgi:Na+:H+ antiporter, NhaA family
MGLLTPSKPLLDQRTARELVRARVPDQLDATELRGYRFLLGETVPVAERLERALHPGSSYVVLPIFALANAGIVLRGGVVGEALPSRVTVGVLLGPLVAAGLAAVLLTVDARRRARRTSDVSEGSAGTGDRPA